MWNHAPQQQQMVGPPPRGVSLGLWLVKHKLDHVLIFEKLSNNKVVAIPMTAEEAEYFLVGQTYSFTATQP